MEGKELEATGEENKSSYNEIKKFLNTIKVLKARFVFNKMKDISATIPFEWNSNAAAGNETSYLNGTTQILKDLLKQQLIINEVHGQIVYDLSKHKKKFKDENSTKTMLIHQRKILDCAYELDEEIKAKQNLITHLIEMNKKWCSFERKFKELLNVNMIKSADILDSTNFRLQQKKQSRKLKKIRQIKKLAEILWSIMSVHVIDYRKDTKFTEILLRINKAKNLSL